MKNWITVEPEFIGVFKLDHPQFKRIGMAYLRGDFIAKFGFDFPESIDYVNYEPEKGLYVVVENDVTTSYAAPDENVYLSLIQLNFSVIIHGTIELQFADYEYDSGTDMWAIPQARQDELLVETEVFTIVSESRRNDRFMFNMIMEMFSVGKAKGLWTNLDFSLKLRERVGNIKTKIDLLDSIDPDGAVSDRIL